jgi:hypothetical protein
MEFSCLELLPLIHILIIVGIAVETGDAEAVCDASKGNHVPEAFRT